MRILLDQNAPRGLRDRLPGHEVVTARQMGWDTLANGALIAAAEAAGFGAMITCDRNLAYQQNLSGRRITLVVLDTNHWDVVRADIDRVRGAVGSVSVGAYIALSFERPVLRRRPYPGGSGE